MKINEGELTFCFDDDWKIVKFDDCEFYKEKFGKLSGGKGIDFITESETSIQLIEVKNCLGHERENLGRTGIGQPEKGKDPFDIEVAKKVAMSISCIYGAFTKSQCRGTEQKLMPFFSAMTSTKIPSVKKVIRVILFLEGNFKTQARTKEMIMGSIQSRLKRQLSWLQCKVVVVDSNTIKGRYFTVEKAIG